MDIYSIVTAWKEYKMIDVLLVVVLVLRRCQILTTGIIPPSSLEEMAVALEVESRKKRYSQMSLRFVTVVVAQVTISAVVAAAAGVVEERESSLEVFMLFGN